MILLIWKSICNAAKWGVELAANGLGGSFSSGGDLCPTNKGSPPQKFLFIRTPPSVSSPAPTASAISSQKSYAKATSSSDEDGVFEPAPEKLRETPTSKM